MQPISSASGLSPQMKSGSWIYYQISPCNLEAVAVPLTSQAIQSNLRTSAPLRSPCPVRAASCVL